MSERERRLLREQRAVARRRARLLPILFLSLTSGFTGLALIFTALVPEADTVWLYLGVLATAATLSAVVCFLDLADDYLPLPWERIE